MGWDAAVLLCFVLSVLCPPPGYSFVQVFQMKETAFSTCIGPVECWPRRGEGSRAQTQSSTCVAS